MNLDRKRIQAVALLESLGFHFDGTAWEGATGTSPEFISAADGMHEYLSELATHLAGATEGGEEEEDLGRLGELIEEYELARWPEGRGRGQ